MSASTTRDENGLTFEEKAKGEADLARLDFDIFNKYVFPERLRQNRKFCHGSPIGAQHHNVITWAAILAEETGEAVQAAIDTEFGQPSNIEKVKTETIQAIAVGFAILERIEKGDAALFAPEHEFPNSVRPD